jgi:hypothetical protein
MIEEMHLRIEDIEKLREKYAAMDMHPDIARIIDNNLSDALEEAKGYLDMFKDQAAFDGDI